MSEITKYGHLVTSVPLEDQREVKKTGFIAVDLETLAKCHGINRESCAQRPGGGKDMAKFLLEMLKGARIFRLGENK